MFSRPFNFLRDMRDRQRVAIAVSKGSAMMQARRIDLRDPSTWEFSGFSQNGEDGIIDVLRSQILQPNRYFVEIGAADGIENNSGWLAVVEKYNGIMVEGSPHLVERARRTVGAYNIGVECLNMFVNTENVRSLKERSFHANPDIFSLDIDGNDYYIAKAIMDCGFRPKIFVVEYNSVYGPDRALTIKYQQNFVFTKAHSTHLYYGVSLLGWRKFFEHHGYRFVTVDKNGVNAFFVDSRCFNTDFLDNIVPLHFADNRSQFLKYRVPSEKQFSLISDQDFVDISRPL